MIETLSRVLLIAAGSGAVSVLLKATAVVIIGLVAARSARRASTRHLILASAFAALLVLPLATLLVPIVAVEVPIAGSDSAIAPRASAPPTQVSESRTAAVSEAGAARSNLPEWPAIVRIGWAAGAVGFLMWLAYGAWQFNRLRRRGLPWPQGRAVVTALAARTGVRRPVEVVLHEDLTAPATCGWRRPAVLLPSDALEWNEADLRRAIVHELEHVRRRDWPVHLMARAVCAAFWFHPLVWIAFREMGLEAERACDDAVLDVLEETEQTDYANQLVHLARRMSQAPVQPILAMANRSDLSARVAAILDSNQPRGRQAFAAAASAMAVAVVLALAVAPVRAVGVTTRPRAAARVENAQQQRAPQRRVAMALDRVLLEAAEEGNLEDISELLAGGANVNAAIDGDGSPLIAAARNGKLAAVDFLLTRGADPNLIVPGDGSPLIMAAGEGHAAVVDLLLNRGASIDQLAPGDENALIQASANGHLRIVQMLVTRGADVNVRVWVETYGRQQSADSRGEWRSPLSVARRNRHTAVVNYLISVGAQQ